MLLRSSHHQQTTFFSLTLFEMSEARSNDWRSDDDAPDGGNGRQHNDSVPIANYFIFSHIWDAPKCFKLMNLSSWPQGFKIKIVYSLSSIPDEFNWNANDPKNSQMLQKLQCYPLEIFQWALPLYTKFILEMINDNESDDNLMTPLIW